MKIVCFSLFAGALLGCRIANNASSVRDGFSLERAIIISGAVDEMSGVAAERVCMEQAYPGFRKGRQTLLTVDGRHYDKIEIETGQGAKTIYFDITSFFGK